MVDRLYEPPSKEALRGTLVHSVLEHLFDLPAHQRTEEAAQQMLSTRWDALKGDDRTSKDIATMFETSDELSAWFESARPLIHSYFALETPAYLQPAAREQHFDALLPNGIAIRGVIDRVDATTDGKLRIIDYKTGKSPSPRFQADMIFQMRFYASALYLMEHNLPLRTQLLFLKDARTLTYDPVERDVDAMIDQLTALWADIEMRLDSGLFEEKPGPLCAWCSFQQYCPAFEGVPPEISSEGIKHLRKVKRGSQADQG